jgi:hypothetical protein
MKKSRSIQYNKREVTIPWFVVGVPDIDVRGTIQAVLEAVKANATDNDSH